MNTRTILLFAFSLTLAACSSLADFTGTDEPAPAPEAPAAAAPVSSAEADAAWCQRVAASDRQRAQGSGYDATTLDRMTLTAYQQCLASRKN